MCVVHFQIHFIISKVSVNILVNISKVSVNALKLSQGAAQIKECDIKKLLFFHPTHRQLI